LTIIATWSPFGPLLMGFPFKPPEEAYASSYIIFSVFLLVCFLWKGILRCLFGWGSWMIVC